MWRGFRWAMPPALSRWKRRLRAGSAGWGGGAQRDPLRAGSHSGAPPVPVDPPAALVRPVCAGALGHGGGGVEAPAAEPERAAGWGAPPPVRRAVAAADRVHAAAVVAEEQAAAVERQRALDRARGVVGPAHRAVACAQRID